MKRRILTLLSLATFWGASAETIDECQLLAKQNYPLVKRYELLQQTENFTLANIGRGWWPQIGFSAQGTWQSAVPELPDALLKMLQQTGTTVKGIDKLQYRATLDLQQNIYDGGTMAAQRRITRATADVEEAATDMQLYALRDRICNLSFGVLLLDKQLLLNEELQRTLCTNLQRVQTLLEGGVAMQSDADALSAELATARQQQIGLNAQREGLLKVLSLFTGKEITNIEATPVTTHATLRPELNFYTHREALIDAREKALTARLRPHIGLFAQGYYGYLGMNMFRDMMERTPTLNALAGIRASWNLSAFYTHKNERHKLALERETIRNDREVFLFNQRLQSAQEDSETARYRRLMDEDDKICTLRRRVREASEAKLTAGIIDISTLVQDMARENQANINRSLHEVQMLWSQYKQQIIKGEE